MAHRIDVKEEAGALRIDFEGVLDGPALREIAVALRLARSWVPRAKVALVLAPGTEVVPECIDALRRLDGIEVRPASPFLARWLGAR